MALKSLPEKHRLIHHSDRGVQYCSYDYVELLKKQHVRISMTQTGDPLDNAIAERVNGILKSELLENIYPDINTSRDEVAKAISTYNFLRPHSSIDMLTPVDAHVMEGFIKKRWKNYYAVKKEQEVLMV
jgi:putative transposase